ncbi:MAG: type II toxin-antitoxin system VapC family toxin [Rickettsiales bacterium]|jgi:tRNA(fMet)-specific endonuclease VapC|nr:type II toxin-antitoxin system VapC family toxin [Rickettsiales bacterium]
MQKYMLDTDICNHAIRNQSKILAQRICECKPKELCVSAITSGELRLEALRKKSSKLLARVEDFISNIRVIGIGEQATEIYAEILCEVPKNEIAANKRNALVAATAMAEGAVLITNNAKHFSKIKRLKTDCWL